MIEAAFIAHTSYCIGWDLDEILDGTLFKKSARTWRFPSEEVQMLDWDFRRLEDRGFVATWQRHRNLAEACQYLEVVMSPDLWSDNWNWAIGAYWSLKNCCERVVMPVHIPPQKSDGLEIAWPMGVWTEDHVAIWDVQDEVTHLLGGSPHAQLRLADYFPNLRTVDGNQAFWCAAKFGKYWKKSWTKPDPPLSTEECFRESVRNITEAWEGK